MDENLIIKKIKIPKPKGAAAVSTAIETEKWWYFSQVKRKAIFACKKLGQ